MKTVVTTFIILIVTGCFFQLGICFEGISDKDLVGYWPLDDGAGETVEDVSGNGNNGKIEGKAKWVGGILGGALELRTEDKAKVTIPNHPTINPTKEITLCAWIKPISIYDGDNWKKQNTVFGKSDAYYLTITDKKNLASYLFGTNPQEWLMGKTDLGQYIGDWVHVATTYDGSKHILYVNGNQDASVVKTGNITESNKDLHLGWVDYDRYIDGVIDEAMVWTRALSEKEIKDLVTAVQAVSPKDKLAVSWGKIKERRQGK